MNVYAFYFLFSIFIYNDKITILFMNCVNGVQKTALHEKYISR